MKDVAISLSNHQLEISCRCDAQIPNPPSPGVSDGPVWQCSTATATTTATARDPRPYRS